PPGRCSGRQDVRPAHTPADLRRVELLRRAEVQREFISVGDAREQEGLSFELQQVRLKVRQIAGGRPSDFAPINELRHESSPRFRNARASCRSSSMVKSPPPADPRYPVSLHSCIYSRKASSWARLMRNSRQTRPLASGRDFVPQGTIAAPRAGKNARRATGR